MHEGQAVLLGLRTPVTLLDREGGLSFPGEGAILTSCISHACSFLNCNAIAILCTNVQKLRGNHAGRGSEHVRCNVAWI